MKKKLTFTALLICFHILLFAQGKTVDSLENLLKQHIPKDTARITLLNKIAYELRRTDYEKGYKYAQEADSLSDKLNFGKGKAESLRMIGRYFRSKGDFPKSLEYAQNALKINETIRYKAGIAYCLGDISAIYIFQNNYTLAIEYANKALKLAEEINDNIQKSLYFNNLGIIYQKMGDYPKSLLYYQTGLAIAEKISDKYSINAYLGNIGVIYEAQGNYPQALQYYQKSLKLCEASNDKRGVSYASANIGEVYIKQGNDIKALDYYQESLKVAEEIADKFMILTCISYIGDIYIKQANYSKALSYLQKGLSSSKETGTQSLTSQILLSIGTIHEKQNELPEALEFYQKALKISEEIGEKPPICNIYINIGSVYLKQKNYAAAMYYSNKSLVIAKELKLLDNESKIVLQLSEIYRATGDYRKAYQTFKTYKQLHDSVFNAENLKQITGLEYTFKYEKEKQATELQQQKKDEVEALKLRRQKIIAYAVGIVLLLTCFIAFLLYRNNRQQKKAYSVLKSTQSQLVQSEKMASLGEMVAGIAHEIQNPLNFVNNFSEVNTELIEEMQQEMDKGNLEDAKTISNDIKENELKINHHGKIADSIVKGMLLHSRSSSGIKEPIDINALADEYLRLSYDGLRAKDKSFNATMKTDYDETIGKIDVVPQEMGRVILNILNNAFYAVTEKKKMSIAGYEPTVSVSTKRNNGNIEISIRDNGTGIPQNILNKIFQPFFTTKPTGQGNGLGLSLSFDIIHNGHGGQIKVESKEGDGSTFIVQLPLNELVTT